MYTILNTRNGKVYVGWTNHPKERWRKHRKNVGLGLSFYLYRAMAKEPERFEFKVFAEHHTEDEAKEAEKYWISFFKSNDDRFGYNMSEGGEGCVRRGKDHWMYGRKGELAYWWGKKQHENTRRALAKATDERRERRRPIIEMRMQQVKEEFEKRHFGAVMRLSRLWGISHTQVRNFIKRYMQHTAVVQRQGRTPV